MTHFLSMSMIILAKAERKWSTRIQKALGGNQAEQADLKPKQPETEEHAELIEVKEEDTLSKEEYKLSEEWRCQACSSSRTWQ